MSLSDAARAELAELVDNLQEQVLTDADSVRLNDLLAGDARCRREYIRLMTMYSAIRSMASDEKPSESQANAMVLSAIASRRDRQAGTASSVSGNATPAIFPTLASNGATNWHGAFNQLASGWPMAYLMATMIVGMGIAIAAVTQVSSPEQFASFVPLCAENQQGIAPKSEIVGRITDMANCIWERGTGGVGAGAENRKPAIHKLNAPVALGERFAIRSGLLEITYQSGAKVILQGPVTYEVESAAGGYLSIGKLTASLAERREGRGESAKQGAANLKSEVKTRQSPLSATPSPLFAVRTPTAIVTDLGTEFGVEVDRRGRRCRMSFVGLSMFRNWPPMVKPLELAEFCMQTNRFGFNTTNKYLP